MQELLCKSIISQKIDPQLLNGIIPGGNLSTQEALEVYLNGYPARLTDALGQVYEAVWPVLGDEEFFRVCREYILKYPYQS